MIPEGSEPNHAYGKAIVRGPIEVIALALASTWRAVNVLSIFDWACLRGWAIEAIDGCLKRLRGNRLVSLTLRDCNARGLLESVDFKPPAHSGGLWSIHLPAEMPLSRCLRTRP
jgi:hypothetical protein